MRDWLPKVLQYVQPYVSSEDIGKGSRWNADIAKELAQTDFGIVYVTAENQAAAWRNFEAGALAKSLDVGHVVPLRVDLSETDLRGPLTQFQGIGISRDEIRKLVQDMNALAPNPLAAEVIVESVDMWWDKLDARLVKALEPQPGQKVPPRGQTDLLEEILTRVREIQRELPSQAPRARAGGLFDREVLARSLVRDALKRRGEEARVLSRPDGSIAVLGRGKFSDETVSMLRVQARSLGMVIHVYDCVEGNEVMEPPSFTLDGVGDSET